MKLIIQRFPADDEIRMTADGRFIDPPPTPIATKIFRMALLVAVASAALGFAVLAIWFTLMLIPLALAAGAVAWAAWRWRMWKMSRGY
ncbi:MAG: hypothetical protein NT133_22895 [Alphaproteobacteria bacterium]|nr:hypothetical protein [Alphaproteobacteria bacterium]